MLNKIECTGFVTKDGISAEAYRIRISFDCVREPEVLVLPIKKLTSARSFMIALLDRKIWYEAKPKAHLRMLREMMDEARQRGTLKPVPIKQIAPSPTNP